MKMPLYIKLWADIRGIDVEECERVCVNGIDGFMFQDEFHPILMDDSEVAFLRWLNPKSVRIINKKKAIDVIGRRRKKSMSV